MRYFKKLLLNLIIIALEITLILVGVNAFTGKLNPTIGTVSIVGLLIIIYVLISQVQNKRFRYKRPGLLKTTLFVILIAIIATFAGCQPLADWKDKAFDYVSGLLESHDNNTNNTTETINITRTSETITPSTPKPTISPTPTEDKAILLGKQVLNKVNSIRDEKGIPLLSWDDTLYKYSIEHSIAMANQRELFHSDMNLPYAENAWGGEGSKSWGAETIVNSWMNSSKHRTWLLCPHLKHIAVGIAYSNNGMYASWTFWRNETVDSDWWYQYTPDSPPEWWY